MLTTLKLALAAAIAATGGYALQNSTAPAPAQNTKPVWTLASSTETPIQDERLNRKVSVKIEGSVSDVAKWLTEQGVSFVISDQNLSQKKVMINLIDQPLKDAVDAIAESLGGRWAKKGDVYVFQSANPFWSNDGKYLKWDQDTMPKVDGKTFELKLPPMEFKELDKAFVMPKIDLKELEQLHGKTFVMPKIDGKDFTFVMPKIDLKDFKEVEGRKMNEAERKQFEKAMKEAQEEMRKAMDEMKKAGKMKVFTDGQQKELKVKGLSESQRKTIEKSMKDAQLQMEKARDEMKKSEKVRMFSDEDLKELKNLKELKVAKPFMFESGQIGKLMKSLTPAQKELHKKKGYLTPGDLSPDQRRMLPTMDGDWNISFVVDGQTLSLKNN